MAFNLVNVGSTKKEQDDLLKNAGKCCDMCEKDAISGVVEVMQQEKPIVAPRPSFQGNVFPFKK